MDNDPIAVAHTELLLADVPAVTATVTDADVAEPDGVLSAPAWRTCWTSTGPSP